VSNTVMPSISTMSTKQRNKVMREMRLSKTLGRPSSLKVTPEATQKRRSYAKFRRLGKSHPRGTSPGVRSHSTSMRGRPVTIVIKTKPAKVGRPSKARLRSRNYQRKWTKWDKAIKEYEQAKVDAQMFGGLKKLFVTTKTKKKITIKPVKKYSPSYIKRFGKNPTVGRRKFQERQRELHPEKYGRK
jgi:hypothetical protein